MKVEGGKEGEREGKEGEMEGKKKGRRESVKTLTLGY